MKTEATTTAATTAEAKKAAETAARTAATAKPLMHDGFHGKSVESQFLNVCGYDWKVNTSKRYGGKIATTYSGGKFEKGEHFNSFTTIIFQDPSGTLNEVKARATAKTLFKLHEDGLQDFRVYLYNRALELAAAAEGAQATEA